MATLHLYETFSPVLIILWHVSCGFFNFCIVSFHSLCFLMASFRTIQMMGRVVSKYPLEGLMMVWWFLSNFTGKMHVKQDKFCRFYNQTTSKAIPTCGATILNNKRVHPEKIYPQWWWVVEGGAGWMRVLVKVVWGGDGSEGGDVPVGTSTPKWVYEKEWEVNDEIMHT